MWCLKLACEPWQKIICLNVCVCVCVRWQLGNPGDKWVLTLTVSPPGALCHVRKWTWCFIPCGFQKYRGMGPRSPPRTPTRLNSPTTPYPSTLHKHSAKAQWESAGWPSMYAVVCDPYLFLWLLQAASHRRVTHRHTEGPPNTDPLCSHGGTWEEPSAAQDSVHLCTCVCLNLLYLLM